MMPRFSLNHSDLEFVFDLDDTLYAERDYAHSALRYVGDRAAQLFEIPDASAKLLAIFEGGSQDAIGTFWNEANLPISAKPAVISEMQSHQPAIRLRPDAKAVLDRLRDTERGFAIVTDGRSLTQRAKLAALGCLDAKFISISEEVGFAKTDARRFEAFAALFPSDCYCYVGDNPAKDFIAPNRLGWKTFRLTGDGRNIRNSTVSIEPAFQAQTDIGSLAELLKLIR